MVKYLNISPASAVTAESLEDAFPHCSSFLDHDTSDIEPTKQKACFKVPEGINSASKGIKKAKHT
jgi:hypothetical protein